MKDIYRQIGIYRITHIDSGKSYIGKTGMNFGDRWDSHRALLRAGKHSNSYLQNAWNKYGESAFEFAVVEVVSDPSSLDDLEMKYIAEYKGSDKSYNLHQGGSGGYNLGKHLSDKTKRKIGEKNRINMTGRKASAETRAKMSSSHLARYKNWTSEDREKFGKLMSECASGYSWSEEAKKKFSEKQRLAPNSAKFTPEIIRSIRNRHAAGELAKDLAEEYGTTPAYISSIIHYRRWAHI